MQDRRMDDPAILALWNDCATGAEQRYEEWYLGQHLPERLAIPGFLSGWRYRAVQGAPQYFTYYETTSPAVFESAAYLERINNPTPLTQEIMSGIFINMSRTVCRRTARVGVIRGSHAVTVRQSDPGSPDGPLAMLLEHISEHPGVVRCELWNSCQQSSTNSAESALRGGPDELIGACLLVETVDEAQARDAVVAIEGALAAASMDASSLRIGIYRSMCSLLAEDI